MERKGHCTVAGRFWQGIEPRAANHFFPEQRIVFIALLIPTVKFLELDAPQDCPCFYVAEVVTLGGEQEGGVNIRILLLDLAPVRRQHLTR